MKVDGIKAKYGDMSQYKCSFVNTNELYCSLNLLDIFFNELNAIVL